MENRHTTKKYSSGTTQLTVIKDIKISSDKVTWTVNYPEFHPELWFSVTSYFKSMKIGVGLVSSDTRGGSFDVDLGNFKYEDKRHNITQRSTDSFGGQHFNKDEAVSLASAFYVLKRYAEGYTRDDSAADAAFANEAKRYREMPVKPALSEDVQRCRIMAEDAFNNKDFEKALEYYRKGLTIEPLWPQGQFNAAMLAGELHWYDWAALYMKHYLELVPDAKNANIGREKMYLWEGKAKEEMQK